MKFIAWCLLIVFMVIATFIYLTIPFDDDFDDK